jgi:hypothetical protein
MNFTLSASPKNPNVVRFALTSIEDARFAWRE